MIYLLKDNLKGKITTRINHDIDRKHIKDFI